MTKKEIKFRDPVVEKVVDKKAPEIEKAKWQKK